MLVNITTMGLVNFLSGINLQLIFEALGQIYYMHEHLNNTSGMACYFRVQF